METIAIESSSKFDSPFNGFSEVELMETKGDDFSTSSNSSFNGFSEVELMETYHTGYKNKDSCCLSMASLKSN